MNLTISSVSSLPLAMTSLAVSSIVTDDLGVVTNNVRALVDLGVDLLAVSGDNLLALLGVGGVDHNVVLLMTLLPLLLDGLLVTLLLDILVTLGTAGVALDTGLRGSLGSSLPLAIVTSMDDLGVVTNNGGAVVNLLVRLLTVLGHDVLALLDIGGVHNSLAHGPGHLAGVLLGDLVALLLHMLLALGAGAVSMVTSLGISLSLSLAVMSVSNNLGVMTDNSGAVVNLLGHGVAVLGHDVLALLDVGGVNNGVVLLVADLPLVLDGPLVALLVGLAEALEVVVGGVSVSGLGLGIGVPLGVVTSVDELRVVTNNGGAVVNLLAGLAAVLGHDVGALLDVGGVHNNVILLMADVLVVSLALLVVDGVVDDVALDVVPLAVTMTVTSMRGVSHGGGQGGSGEEEGGADSVHHDQNWEYFFPPTL